MESWFLPCWPHCVCHMSCFSFLLKLILFSFYSHYIAQNVRYPQMLKPVNYKGVPGHCIKILNYKCKFFANIITKIPDLHDIVCFFHTCDIISGMYFYQKSIRRGFKLVNHTCPNIMKNRPREDVCFHSVRYYSPPICLLSLSAPDLEPQPDPWRADGRRHPAHGEAPGVLGRQHHQGLQPGRPGQGWAGQEARHDLAQSVSHGQYGYGVNMGFLRI